MHQKESKKLKNQKFDSIEIPFTSENQELDAVGISKLVETVISFTQKYSISKVDTDSLDFSNICKFIRNTFQVSQKQIAKKLNINVRSYQYLEYGRFNPNWKQGFNLYILFIHAKAESTTPLHIGQEAA